MRAEFESRRFADAVAACIPELPVGAGAGAETTAVALAIPALPYKSKTMTRAIAGLAGVGKNTEHAPGGD